MTGLQSCHKDNSVMPSITKIRAALPAPNDTTLTFVTSNQVVVLEGSNLMAAQQVLFDGVPATYNSALTANNTLIITVPVIVFSAVDSTKTNTVQVISAAGTFTYHFPVQPPPPVIQSISNEFAIPGDTITINGQFLYLIQQITFPGGIPGTVLSGDPGGTWINVIVPAGATTGGSITITTTGGTGMSDPAAGFNDQRGMICNFDNIMTFQYWAASMTAGNAFPGGHGNYAEMAFTGVNAGDGSWWGNERSINLNSTQWMAPDSLGNPVADYVLKFEIYVKIPWTSGEFQITNEDAAGHTAVWEPWLTATGNSYITDGWQTVSIPLSSFYDSNGGVPATLSTLVDNTGSSAMSIRFIGGTQATAAFDAAIDNIRVVKIQ